ncbi:MAG: LacI family DNA-binding transcriptional regulator [Phycisphaerales bacterium]
MKTVSTIQDIAKAVGVTHVTVSRAFSGKNPVSPKTRRRIMEVAHSMGYRPSAAARAVRTGRTGFVGMLRSPSPACSVIEPLFDAGIDEALHGCGLCLVRDIVDDITENQPHAQPPRIVRENVVDGLLINYAFGTPPPVRDLLDRCRVPAIWINRKRDTNCVRPNDEGAALEATRHLLAHGHTRIAFIPQPRYEESPHSEEHYSVADRQSGYESAMRQAGLTPRIMRLPPIPTDAPLRLGHLLRSCVQLLGWSDRPSAVLCGFSGGGRTMLLAAAHAGLRVPDDLSVMTFDNDAGADERIAVDRVLVRYRAMGQASVNELCALIDQPDVPRSPVVIPFEFHRTGSVARPIV